MPHFITKFIFTLKLLRNPFKTYTILTQFTTVNLFILFIHFHTLNLVENKIQLIVYYCIDLYYCVYMLFFCTTKINTLCYRLHDRCSPSDKYKIKDALSFLHKSAKCMIATQHFNPALEYHLHHVKIFHIIVILKQLDRYYILYYGIPLKHIQY
jgi:hypothetical protein